MAYNCCYWYVFYVQIGYIYVKNEGYGIVIFMLKKISDNLNQMDPFRSPPPRMYSSAWFTRGSNRLTGPALLSGLHFCNYRKAVDLIDHVILAGKLMVLDIPQGILC